MSTATIPTPATVAMRHATMRRRAAEAADARWMRTRRADARSHGYHGPLTRAELARQAGK